MKKEIAREKEYLNSISGMIIDAAFSVHKELGPGLLESVYHHCLLTELRSRNANVLSYVQLPVIYKGQPVGKDYFIDMLVEDEIIVELKAVEVILPVHEAQVISYLRLAKKQVGLLINFNVPIIKAGLKRFVNCL